MNPVDPVLLARAHNRLERYAQTTTRDPEVLRRVHLLLDCDAKRPKGIAATDQEVLAAVTRSNEVVGFLRELGWPELVRALSGNGAHALVPINLANTSESEALVKQVLAALAERFSDDVVELDSSVYNASRITKLYGTVAVKGDVMPDRPHRRTMLEFTPAESLAVTPEQLREVAALAPGRRTIPRRRRPTGTARSRRGRPWPISRLPACTSRPSAAASMRCGASGLMGIRSPPGSRKRSCSSHGTRASRGATSACIPIAWIGRSRTFMSSSAHRGGASWILRPPQDRPPGRHRRRRMPRWP